jgi:hypothetical protein
MMPSPPGIRETAHKTGLTPVIPRPEQGLDPAKAIGQPSWRSQTPLSDVPIPVLRGGPLRVGINVSGLLVNNGYVGKKAFDIALDYPVLIRDLIRFFQGEGAEVHLVPHVLPMDSALTHGEDDTRANVALAAEFPAVVLAPRFASPSAAKSYIAGLDFFIGARMHACIAAFSSGVPVIPMAYSRKFSGMFGTLGYGRTVDCTREDGMAILAKVKADWAMRHLMKGEVIDSLARGQEKLNLYALSIKGTIRG